MSRIGRLAVAIPSGVSVDLRGSTIEVKGPAGTLKENVPAAIRVEIADGRIAFARPDDKKTNRALHGLVRARVANMVRGVTERFVRALEIQGVSYRAEVQGQKLVLTVGYSHPVAMQIPAGLKASVDRNVAIRIEGLDRGHSLGVMTLSFRGGRPPARTLALLEQAADRLGTALENVRLLEDSLRRASKERLISEITSRIGSSSSVEPALTLSPATGTPSGFS